MTNEQIADELFEQLDGCISTYYPDYGYDWDKEEALKHIQAAIEKATYYTVPSTRHGHAPPSAQPQPRKASPYAEATEDRTPRCALCGGKPHHDQVGHSFVVKEEPRGERSEFNNTLTPPSSSSTMTPASGAASSEPCKEERGGPQFAKSYGPHDSCVQVAGLTFTVNVSAKAVAYKINAALAAEQSKAAKAEAWAEDRDKLRQQLLAAQAAIANVKTELEALEYHYVNNQREFFNATVKSMYRKFDDALASVKDL